MSFYTKEDAKRDVSRDFTLDEVIEVGVRIFSHNNQTTIEVDIESPEYATVEDDLKFRGFEILGVKQSQERGGCKYITFSWA